VTETNASIDQSPEIGELAKALAKAQMKIKGAIKYAENPHFHYRYADLATVWDACREPLSAEGLAVIQTTDGTHDQVVILTTLAHSSGQWIRGRLVLKPVKADPQGIGSCLTYGRRYALAAMVGVAPEDDDGNQASGTTHHKEHAPASEEQHPPRKRPTPGVDQMLKTGQAVPATPAPATPALTTPEPSEEADPLQAIKMLMEISGISIPELKGYLAERGFIPAGGMVKDMDQECYTQIIQDENWAKVVERIKAKRTKKEE
jgi:hypothetical protein